ncbi:Sensor histidine kinase RcsC [Cupriavidus yeoncheonensis]|uniref:Virulence sensor protein BvgS n=1 Tax=Cupriavidus yeoncheonensis TaxID=1462994 RepID=A0A916N6N4_9BURK|nr:ATP-binding protein [Cupriavidus yeoncheonensis]CAG2156088.1 Sensor histidine kinase RcsC [Cupriavidus yeoncheonensis]
MVIVLISSLAYLLFQARKDALDNLLLHQARLAVQLASAELRSDTSGGVTLIDDGGRHSGTLVAGIGAWPGQKTIVIPLASGCAASPLCDDLAGAQSEDTRGRFVIRNGALFASLHGSRVAVTTSAPLSALPAGLLGRLAMDIAAVFFLGCLLLLVRESRLSDYSVHRLLDASPIPLLLIDAQGQVEFANRQALDLFLDDPLRTPGRLQEALRREGKLFTWLISEQDAGGATETCEFETHSQAGAARHLLVSRQSLAVRAKRMIIASMADITVRHEAESALVKAKNAAEALERMKSESLAMMSHELRTPVNGVLGLAQLLVQHELPDGAAQIVRRMIQAGKTLAVIINDIVDFALLEVRHIRLERRRFDLREVITGAATLASAAAAEKGLMVRVSALAPLPPAVFGDPARLQQIIINLVGNGIKFTDAGHIEVRTDIAARVNDSIEIVIDVADTGIGIAPEVVPRLFRPFSQAEAGYERRFEGTGLGLAISKGLAEAMGGSISVRSTIGEGSTFSVRLPFELALREGESAPTPAPASASSVLVVDDVALNRDVVSDLLRAEGCEVTTAGSGQEALDILKTRHFDLILMDIRMPVMDGLATTAAIRSSREPNRHTGPILGLTANPLPTDRPLYLLRGIDGIIEKPVEVEALRSALRQAALPATTAVREEPERLGRLRQKLGQDRTLRIVMAFKQTAAEALEGIATGCARAGLDTVAEDAHRLAGAASNVGFDQLAEAAASLEQIARTGSATEVLDAALTVVTIYRDVERFVGVLVSPAAGPENRYPVP